jgi:hypothetical protein
LNPKIIQNLKSKIQNRKKHYLSRIARRDTAQIMLEMLSIRVFRGLWMFAFGLEHEVAFLNAQGQFADFSNTQFADFQQIIEQLPVYSDDQAYLRLGDAGIRKKRWYIEGFERFSEAGKLIDCIPKGIEIRTTVHAQIHGAIAELFHSFQLLRQVAADYGYTPVLTSFNPYQSVYSPTPPLNGYERSLMSNSPEEETELIAMLTYGPDLNLSNSQLTVAQLIDAAQKLTFYSPYIVPFSFSSPFYCGQHGNEAWRGLSRRTYVRTGDRPAALVFLGSSEDLIDSTPSLTKLARIPSEVGRLEFKAFDSCDDFSKYGSLLSLLKGIILDSSLPGRATIPDRSLHQRSALEGFSNPEIYHIANQVLTAAAAALTDDVDQQQLIPLKQQLQSRLSPAHALIQSFQDCSLDQVLRQTYALN